jgi:hypothetical protein
VLLVLAGCGDLGSWTTPPSPSQLLVYDNPLRIPIANHEVVWEGVVDVISDYFRIDQEEPVRLLGSTLTEGRIDTYPTMGATFLEPWSGDSANSYERLEATLQSIRRRAVVRVVPAQDGGFWVDVAVFKELENLKQPEHSTAGAATFPLETTHARVVNPEQLAPLDSYWIPQGRDLALEQKILGELQYRFSPQGQPRPVR